MSLAVVTIAPPFHRGYLTDAEIAEVLESFGLTTDAGELLAYAQCWRTGVPRAQVAALVLTALFYQSSAPAPDHILPDPPP